MENLPQTETEPEAAEEGLDYSASSMEALAGSRLIRWADFWLMIAKKKRKKKKEMTKIEIF